MSYFSFLFLYITQPSWSFKHGFFDLSGKVILPEQEKKHHKTPVAVLREHAKQNTGTAQHAQSPHRKQLQKYIHFLRWETSDTQALGLFRTRILSPNGAHLLAATQSAHTDFSSPYVFLPGGGEILPGFPP